MFLPSRATTRGLSFCVVMLSVSPLCAGEGKGGLQKGHGTHVCHHHGCFHGEPPPAGQVFESVAIRRVPLQQQVSFRVQQQAQQGQFESTPLDDNRMQELDRRLDALEDHVTKLYDALERLVDKLAKEEG